MLTVLDRWLDALDSVVHAVGKKLSVLALSSMLTSNVPYVIFCYKIIHVPVDLNSADFFRFAISSTCGHSFKLQKQDSSVDACKFYFSNRVVDAWNHLSDHVVNATSLSSFKRRLSLTTVYQLI